MTNILAVSHCILNSAAKVEQDEAGLAEEYRVRRKLMQLVLDNNIQALQLPCPEFMIFGSRRWGHVKDQFDNPFFREQCRRMLEPVMLQMEEYSGNPDRFSIIGIVSVEGSPSCGRSLTCRADWGGELPGNTEMLSELVASVRMVEEPGVFMEELRLLAERKKLDIPILTMDEAITAIRRSI